MPGGADLPYCRRLNGKGNRIIKGESDITNDLDVYRFAARLEHL